MNFCKTVLCWILCCCIIGGSVKANDYQVSDSDSVGQFSSSKGFGWLQENFPIPNNNPVLCRSSSNSNNNSNINSNGKVQHYHRVCDPDAVLSTQEIMSLESLLSQKRSFLGHCQVGAGLTSPAPSLVRNVEIGVAVVNKMDLRPYQQNSMSNLEEHASETFARSVHDSWGVGSKTSCGGTGVLIFLSILDRTIYISRGGAVEEFVTNSRVDKIISKIKPQLRSGDYYDALEICIDEISNYIVNVGPPTLYERFVDLLPLLVIIAAALFLVWKAYNDRHQARQYAHVSSQLNEMDRARAEALQGRYRATSCPICLEDFHVDDEGNPQNGSDEQSIKLLRCGHTFHETCWTEWVNNGQGDVTKCPICQQDVSGEHAAATTVNNPHDHRHHHQHNTNDATNDDDGQHQQVVERREDQVNEIDIQRVQRLYYRERNFRLARLGNRYPQFIRPQQLQAWTSSTYDGTLSRDPEFVNKDPALRRIDIHGDDGASSGSGPNSSFGGGSSSGGRGGRW